MTFLFFPPRREGKMWWCQDMSFSWCKQNFHYGHRSQLRYWGALGNSACKIFQRGLESNRTCSAEEITTLGKNYSKAVLTPYPLNNVSIAEFTSKQIRGAAEQQTWGTRIKIWWYFTIKGKQHTGLALGLEGEAEGAGKLSQKLSCNIWALSLRHLLGDQSKKSGKEKQECVWFVVFPKTEIKLPHL